MATFQWPNICRTLSAQCGPQLDRVVDLLRTQANAGHSVIGLMGLRPPPIYVAKRPLPEEAVPTVIEPLVSTVQQIAPDSAAEEAPSEQPPEDAAGVAVTADSSAVAFAVPTVGNVLVPMSMAQAPPAHPMQAVVPINSAHIEQINATGTGGSRPAPPYPRESQLHQEQGTVTLEIQGDEYGRVLSVRSGLDVMSVFFFDESGDADGDGDGLAARQGVMMATPKKSAAKAVKRKRPDAEGEVC